MDFGEVQKKILTKILLSDGLRYSEAYPGDEIDDDLFNYHLQQLVKNGLVEKVGGKYQLTSRGRSKVQMLDSKGELQEQFRVSVLIFVTRNDGKEVLMCKRTRWPLRGDIVSPAGKVKRGEIIVEAARRKLKEEAGLETNFKLVGVLRSIRRFENTVVEDTIYNVCVGKDPTGTLTGKSEYGEFYWTDFKTAIGYGGTNVGGSKAQIEILERVRDNNPEVFFVEEEIDLKSY